MGEQAVALMPDRDAATLLDQGFEDWCSFCGVNPVYSPGLCSSCQADEDFLNCPYCHGTSCTQACEEDEYGD